jgi:hypothetical protein
MTKLHFLINNKPSKRWFTSTSSRRVDPLGTVALALATPYPPSYLFDPFSATLLVLLGMAGTLFFVSVSLVDFFASDPSYVMILQRIDNLLLFYETFLSKQEIAIDMMLANLNNIAPEALTNYYFSLQELVAVTESIFPVLSNEVNSPNIELLPEPLVIRINQN